MSIQFEELLDKIIRDETASEIDLANEKLNDERIQVLTQALIKNSSVKVLKLSGNNFSIKGTKAITQLLKLNTSLTSINLKLNNLGHDGIKLISEALKLNTSLTSIELGRNNLGPEGAKLVSEALIYNTSLTAIDLRSNNLGTEGIKFIVEALRHNTSLASISLEETTLGLTGTRIIAETLKLKTSITSLSLFNSNLGPEGAKIIAEALKCNATLASLKLGGSKIGSMGAKLISEALKLNTSLTFIDLEENHLGREESKILSDINTSLDRNIIQSIWAEIVIMSPTLPLPESSGLEFKECAEINFEKHRQSISAKCVTLESRGCAKDIIISLRAEAFLAYISNDHGEEPTREERERGALTSQERINALQSFSTIIKEGSPCKKRILSLLLEISMHLGKLDIHSKRHKEAREHFLLAYTCALHVPQDTTSKNEAAEALAFWMEREKMGGFSETRSTLEEELAKTDISKFRKLKSAYEAQCTILGLSPLTHLKESKETQEITMQFELHKQSAKTSAALELNPDISAQSTVLALDSEVEEKPEFGNWV